MWKPEDPYNDLPPLEAANLESVAVLKALPAARAAVAALDQAVKRLPNPGVLISAIPLLEAKASSEIENIVTTTDELFSYSGEFDAATPPAVKETLHYREALFAGFKSVKNRPITLQTAELVCSTVKNAQMRVRDYTGTYIGDPVTREARYTPPVGRDVIVKKMHDWERFINTAARGQNIDPLVVMAAAHYQFEAIHPFSDGNGRTGRILNEFLLNQEELLAEPILYLSRYIIEHKDEYYRQLRLVTSDGDWEGWILFMLAGVRETAQKTLQLIDAIQELQNEFRAKLRDAQGLTVDANLLELLFKNPYCRIGDVVKHCGVSRPTATSWLRRLVKEGLLHEVRRGRERLFINQEFMRVLERA